MAHDYLTKVRALVETANSYEAQAGQAETKERREELMGASQSFRDKAEMLMKKYRIEEEEALAKETISVEPVLHTFDVCPSTTPYRQQYINLAYYAANHVGARTYFEYGNYENGVRHIRVHMVGYEMDVEYAEMLFTSAYMVFNDRLEPKVKPELSDQVNAYRLRSAGIERRRASVLLWGHDGDPGRVGRLYLAECKARGETPGLTGRGVTGKVYREQYAEEFVYVLGRRLRQARNAADSVGGGLVLHGRQERVDEAFYRRFPELKPVPATQQPEPEPCKNCKPGKLCRTHQAQENEYQRAAEKRRRAYFSQAGMAGRANGAQAATYVDLGVKGKAQRVDSKTTTTGNKELGS